MVKEGNSIAIEVLHGAGLLPADALFLRRRLFWLFIFFGFLAFPILLFIFRYSSGQVVLAVPLAVSLLLISPLVEEVIFRGFLQGWMLENKTLSKSCFSIMGIGFTLANLATTCLFVALHFYSHSALWALLVFFPSIIFGLARERWGNIYAAVLLHSFYNFIYVFATQFQHFSL